MVWRLVTGKRTRHDDPKLQELTGYVSQQFRDFDPGNPLTVLQLNCYPLVRLMSWLGLPNMVDNSKALMDMLWGEIERSGSDKEGNYIERGLYEVEHGEDRCCFNEQDGRKYIRAQLQDLFSAGNKDVVYCLSNLIC